MDELDIERAAGQYEALLQEQRRDGEAEAQRAELNRQMEKLSNQKTRLVQMNLDGAITDAELVELMRENRALLDAYAERLQALPEPEARAADIRAMVTELRQALQAARGDVFRALDRRCGERYIDRIDRKNVLLQGGRAVPISRSKQEETRTRYLLYRGARL